MNTNTLTAIAAVILAVVLFFTLRNRRYARKMLDGNQKVAPLMLQKATQTKVSRLQEVTKNNAHDNEQLLKLVAAYRNNQLNIHDYNARLDKMIFRLDVDL